MAERTSYEPGAFCWVGLATSDPDGAQAFYARLFAWTPEELPAGEAGYYTLLRRDAQEVAILYRQTAEARAAQAPPHWTSYISVADADAVAARAGELGGAAVFREPFDVPGEGRVAAIRDPAGAIVSLWQPYARIGARLVDDMGALCWIELRTTDVEACKSFYGALLDWEYASDERGYTRIGNAGRPNGGMRHHGGPPHWLPYFGVEDSAAAAGQAERLGGRTLAAPEDTTIGRSAMLADPQRAAFGVLDRGVGQ